MKTVKLGEIVDLNPAPPNAPPVLGDTPVSFLPMALVGEDGGIRPEIQPAADVRKGRTYFARGDIIVAKISPCLENGKAADLSSLPTEHGYGSTEFHVLRCAPGVSSRYVFHMVWSDQFRKYAAGTFKGAVGQQRVAADTVADFAIPLPPLEEQRRIADILDAADALRRKRREALRLLDELQRATFLEMFGDPVTNPKGWPVVPLATLWLDGPTNGLYVPSTQYGRGTPIIRIDAFARGRLSSQAQLRRVDIDAEQKDRYEVRAGELLVNRVNSIEHLGKAIALPALGERTVFESNMMRIRLDEGRVTARFVAHQFELGRIKAQIRNCAKDAVNQSSINQTDVGSLEIMTPPMIELERYETALLRLSEEELLMEGATATTETLFAALLDRAFRGDL